jgi:hypothetical protein
MFLYLEISTADTLYLCRSCIKKIPKSLSFWISLPVISDTDTIDGTTHNLETTPLRVPTHHTHAHTHTSICEYDDFLTSLE